MFKDKILIVDDDKFVLDLLESLLTTFDYDVIKAMDGKEAFEKLAENENVSLVILDIIMPDMDGYEVCRKIKNTPRYENIPVIFTTASNDTDTRIKCIDCGGDDFLEKPVNSQVLQARTRSLIGKKKYQDELKYSYKNINDLIHYADINLSSFDPFSFDCAKSNRALLKNILKNIDEDDGRKPRHVMLINLDEMFLDGRYVIGTIFYKESGELRKVDERITLRFDSNEVLSLSIKECISAKLCNESDSPVISYSNWYESCRDINDYQRIFGSSLTNNIGKVFNFISYSSGNLAVVAFNYGKNVDEYDVKVLKGLVIHTNFFITISNQVRITEEAFRYTVDTLARASEANDDDTHSHIIRVNRYAETLALKMKLPDKFVDEIRFYAQMHDVGKIHIDRNILRKPGKLTEEEFEQMKTHTVIGAKILGDSPKFEMAREIAVSHHEKYSGGGYPYGIRGKGIPLSGRITAMADVYDALRTKRHYKPALPHDKAFNIITKGDGRTLPGHFDPKVFDAFIKSEVKFKKIYDTIQDDNISQ